MEYDSIRKLIDERIEALFPNEKDDYNDDLTYKDIFFTKNWKTLPHKRYHQHNLVQNT